MVARRARWAAVLALTACGEADSDSVPEPVLCDGSFELRFAGTDAGGNLTGVPRVAAEVGWTFLLIDGECHYWSMERPNEPVRTGILDAGDAASFTRELALGRWSSLAEPPSGGCPDAGTTALRFLDEVLATSCSSTAVTDSYRAWLEALHARGSDSTGDVRYSLAYAEGDGWVDSEGASEVIEWPLEADPHQIAIAFYDEENAEPLIATGADAEALRAARSTYLASDAPRPSRPWLRVPVRHGDLAFFNLALRDVTPFEQDGRLFPYEFFER